MEDNRTFEDEMIIDMQPRKRRWGLIVGAALLAAIFLFGSQSLSIYIDSLWFSSVGYAEVFWYKFKTGGLLFVIFLILTFAVMRGAFWFLDRLLPQLKERPRVRVESVEDLREVNVLPLIYRPGTLLLSIFLSLVYASSMSQAWPTFALYWNGAPSGVNDPIFHRDASFYLFTLPALELIVNWLVVISVVLFLIFGLVSAYVWNLERVRVFGNAGETRRRATTAVSAAGALLALAFAASTYLSRFDLLHNQHALFTGVSYTDDNVRLPVMNVLVVVFLLLAVLLIANAVAMKRLKLIGWSAGIVAVLWFLGLVILPSSIYSFSVKPNELAKESPYIEKNIEMTRWAFGIDHFREQPFEPRPAATEEIRNQPAIIENVRLWDPVALQSTFSQIQEIRTYYEFRVPDVDRYIMNGEPRQVLLAAREMNVNQLPAQSRNWINQHLVYTHGYGVTMATVNEFTAEGLPRLVLRNMPVESDVPEIRISRPEIYFGELTNQHVYVDTRPQGTTQPEFSFPAPGDVDSYTRYAGKAGIPVGGFLRRAALAIHLGDGSNLIFSDAVTEQSRVLMRRNILDRVRHIAPFLIFEDDPYIVITDDGRLQWIIDAFTTTDRFPYSAATRVSNRPVNYIRNSVKVVVDAYEGTATFYIFDERDPVVRSYQNLFPSLFQPASAMPEDLRRHVRYPDLMVEVQARVYTLYQMSNAQTFYNREDLWAVATIEQATQAGQEPQPMQPYFVMMKLPGEQQERLEFISILPFTPAGESRNNLIGWLAARSDGEHYGETLVYRFPKNVTVTGPAQIRARFNQDPQLAAQITLWNQQGSRVLRGNLQVIPIANSLLYVEPFYLQANNSPQPELRQVAVGTQDRLATAPTFDKALEALFSEIGPAADGQAQPPPQQTAEQQPAPQAPPPTQQPAAGETARLAARAQQLFAEYSRLTAEGRHGEAGQKLEQLKQTIDELARRSQ